MVTPADVPVAHQKSGQKRDSPSQNHKGVPVSLRAKAYCHRMRRMWVLLLHISRVAYAPLTEHNAVFTNEPGCPTRSTGGGCVAGQTSAGVAYDLQSGEMVVAPPMSFDQPDCAQPRPARVALLHVPKTAGLQIEDMLLESPVNFTLLHDESDVFDPNSYDLFIASVRDPVSRVISAFNYNDPFNLDGSCEASGKSGGLEPCSDLATNLYRNCFPTSLVSNHSNHTGAVDIFARTLLVNSINSTCAMTARACLLESDAMCGANRHLNRGTDWYTLEQRGGNTSVMARLHEGTARILLVRQESLEADVAMMWDWLCVPAHERVAMQEFDRHSWISTQITALRHNDTNVSAVGRQGIAQHVVREQYAMDELERLADNGRLRNRAYQARQRPARGHSLLPAEA